MTACLSALALTACGDDEAERNAGPGTPAPAPAPATTPATTRADPPEPNAEAVAPQRRELEAAGFEVQQSSVDGVSPAPRAALEFPLESGGGVTVFAYGSPADAERKADEFRSLARRFPRNFRVAVEGATAYVGVAEQPERLDPAEFDRAVQAAERR